MGCGGACGRAMMILLTIRVSSVRMSRYWWVGAGARLAEYAVKDDGGCLSFTLILQESNGWCAHTWASMVTSDGVGDAEAARLLYAGRVE